MINKIKTQLSIPLLFILGFFLFSHGFNHEPFINISFYLVLLAIIPTVTCCLFSFVVNPKFTEIAFLFLLMGFFLKSVLFSGIFFIGLQNTAETHLFEYSLLAMFLIVLNISSSFFLKEKTNKEELI